MTRPKAVEEEGRILSYCSWCYGRHWHYLWEQNYLRRNIYRCSNCGNYTVQCRVCDCMAKDRPAESTAETWLENFKENWSSEYCAAHDATIPSWDSIEMTIERPDKFRTLYERSNEWNMVKVTGGVVGSVATAGLCCATFGLAAGPIASALGATGILGSASTGTVIATLHGAALTNASLAAIGIGSMATGTMIVTAAGGAIGGGMGLSLSNSYLGELPDFDIKCVDEGNRNLPAIILLNGFMQKDADAGDWLRSIEEKFPEHPKFHVKWDSKNIRDIANILSGRGAAELAKVLTKKGARKLNSAAWAMTLCDIIGNPWHQALNNAGKAGASLAEILARTTGYNGFILMGHSLGARVAYYAARALATRRKSIIHSMYLLSGAVGVNEWKEIADTVQTKIYNFYAPDDNIVGPIYQAASVGLAETTIGVSEIEYKSHKIINRDVSKILDKYEQSSIFLHMRYKDAFCEMLRDIQPESAKSTTFNILNDIFDLFGI